MNQKCRIEKYYDRRKTIKNNIKHEYKQFMEKYYKSNKNEHNIIFCRTSGNYFSVTLCNCNELNTRYNTWKFYCTLFNYYLCINCILKFE